MCVCVRSVDIDLICPSPIFYFHVPGNPIIGVVPIISPPPITRYGSFSSEPLIGWLDDLICRLSRHFSLISPLFFLFLPLSLFFFLLPLRPLFTLFFLVAPHFDSVEVSDLSFSRLSPHFHFPFSLSHPLSRLSPRAKYTRCARE